MSVKNDASSSLRPDTATRNMARAIPASVCRSSGLDGAASLPAPQQGHGCCGGRRLDPADAVPAGAVAEDRAAGDAVPLPAEVWKLADAIRPDDRSLILLGAFGGLRIGEMAGLRRGRVVLERGTVQVIEVITEPKVGCTSGRPRPAPAGGWSACHSSWSMP
jgi:integrase